MNKDIVQIISYTDELKSHFYKINEQWISSMFVMEDIDKQTLAHPEKYILSRGGKIWFAEHNNLGIVGTCALKKTANDEFELTKMAVLNSARGMKVGEMLLQHVIQFVKLNQVSCCYLLTNSKCEAAIHLYEKNHFVHDREIMSKYGGSYERCNVAMKLALSMPKNKK